MEPPRPRRPGGWAGQGRAGGGPSPGLARSRGRAPAPRLAAEIEGEASRPTRRLRAGPGRAALTGGGGRPPGRAGPGRARPGRAGGGRREAQAGSGQGGRPRNMAGAAEGPRPPSALPRGGPDRAGRDGTGRRGRRGGLGTPGHRAGDLLAPGVGDARCREGPWGRPIGTPLLWR